MLIVHSVTFWFPNINDAADSLNSLFVNFSLYPLTIRVRKDTQKNPTAKTFYKIYIKV
jgi:hypothetical protein